MRKRIFSNALMMAAAGAVLAFSPLGAEAAECFDLSTDDPKAGNATAVVGPVVDVSRIGRSDMFRPESGDDMFSGDMVRTGDDSHLQLKLCDWSTYTFSPNSQSAINEFFDVEGASRRRLVNFVRGGLRYSSGRDTEPGSTEVEIQDSGVTMGVRGTNVILAELDGYVYALLEGPVRDNNGLTPRGLVEFWTGGNRDAIMATLKRPGFVVRIGPDGVSRPFRADAELLKRIYEAFVPVIPENDGSPLEFAGDPLNESGQGAQEGGDYQQFAENKHERDDENTENKPEQPSNPDDDDAQTPPVTIPVGDILPLDVLDDFAGAQINNPDGVLFAIAPAQIDDGTSVSDGVVIFQIHVDWAARRVAPEALASFVRFDGTVTNPQDLTQRNANGYVPYGGFENEFLNALIDSADIPFASGDNGLAIFLTPTYTLTIRQGAADTVTADISSDFSGVDGQNAAITLSGGVDELMLSPGEGELAYFTAPLGAVYSQAELSALMSSGVTTLSGVSTNVISTLGAPTVLTGISFAQIEINFNNRTVGGGSSFIAISAAADPAIGNDNTVEYVALDQAAPFDSGMFGLAFYTLASMSSDPDLQKGQALISSGDGIEGNIAAILADDAGNHLYTEINSYNDFGLGQVAQISDLDALAASLGSGVFRYDGSGRGNAFPGYASLLGADGLYSFGDMFAEININFGNRTVGGGNSYVAVSINDSFSNVSLNFSEALNAVSFDDAVGGAGIFGFGADDFSGANIENALFIIRNDASPGDSADLYVNFTDGAGGTGWGEITHMPRESGETATTIAP